MSKNLELLFDYTKFHIGVYLTLTTVYVTIATATIHDNALVSLAPHHVVTAVVSFMIAGLAGGVIVSSITQTQTLNSTEFLNERIGIYDFGFLHFRAIYWTWIEHTAFWIGLVAAVLSFFK